ncbi:hypothetical protein QTH90_31335, partial [Variovorax sp. J2P1-59]|nr:hypothetical protein [Variovorax sp. J2P1-59]
TGLQPYPQTTGANVVFLAITPNGLKEALRLAADSGPPVSDAISEQAYGAQKAKGLSRFSYPLGAREPLVLEGRARYHRPASPR